MSVRNLVAVVVGGLVAFVWSSISWMVIPWHQPTMEVFQDEVAIGQVIKEAAPRPGIYTYPGWTDDPEDMEAKHAEGPYVFASIVPAGVGSEMAVMMLGGFLIDVIGAALLLTLMLQAPAGAWLRVGIVAAVLVSVIPSLMNWNWWHFSVSFVAVGIADSLISWTLAVLAMGMIFSRPTAEPLN